MRNKKNRYLLPMVLVMLLFMGITGCEKEKNELYQVVTDIDGNVYPIVKIGNQVWMAENLRTKRYSNGDSIYYLPTTNKWSNTGLGAWCNYNNEPDNDQKYGKLYNGYAVHDSRDIAPEGWHVPTADEWWALNVYVSAHPGSSSSVAKALAASTNWASSSVANTAGIDLTTNNSSGFNALPGGFRNYSGNFINESLGHDGYWWSADESVWNLTFNNPDINILYEEQWRFGYSVRCIKDYEN